YGLPQGVPVVSVCYDLIELKFRSHYYPRSFAKMLLDRGPKKAIGNRLRWLLWQSQLAKFASSQHLIAISESTKQDLIHLLRIDANNVSVTPLAAPSDLYPHKHR